jgi:hypothetical protein
MMEPPDLHPKLSELFSGRLIAVTLTRFGNRGYGWLVVWGLMWLVGCAPAEPIEVTRIVEATVTATETAVPTEPSSSAIPSPTPSTTSHLSLIEGQLPPIAYDLLFIADGSLKRWSHEGGHIEILLASEPMSSTTNTVPLGKITSFRLSADGERIVATRFAAVEPLTYDFVAYDLINGNHWGLVDGVQYLLDYDFAPDGRYLAYIEGDPMGDTWQSGLPKSGTIYLKPTEGDEPPEPFGYCSNLDEVGHPAIVGCSAIMWTPNSQELVWADRQGLWLREVVNRSEVRLLVENSFNGLVSLASYRPKDWSPSGRYLRLIVYSDSEVGFHEAVFDFQTGKVLDIPYTDWLAGGPFTTHLTWIQNDRLFSIRGGGEQGEIVAGVLRVEPVNDEFVVETSFIVPGDYSNYANDLVQLENGSLAFSLLNFDNQNSGKAGLYILDSLETVPRKVNNWPFDLWYSNRALWSPDGQGAFVLFWYWDGTNDYVYLPADEPVFYDVRSLLGESVFSVTLLP